MQNTITIQKIYDLTDEYEDALLAEYKAQAELAWVRQQTKKVISAKLSTAYANGDIAGRNADERKRAEDNLVTSDLDILEANAHEVAQLSLTNDAIAHREKLYQLISMTKAWLYSQSGRDPYQ